MRRIQTDDAYRMNVPCVPRSRDATLRNVRLIDNVLCSRNPYTRWRMRRNGVDIDAEGFLRSPDGFCTGQRAATHTWRYTRTICLLPKLQPDLYGRLRRDDFGIGRAFSTLHRESIPATSILRVPAAVVRRSRNNNVPPKTRRRYLKTVAEGHLFRWRPTMQTA